MNKRFNALTGKIEYYFEPAAGPKGDTGPRGPQGIIGLTGPQGAPGVTGLSGRDGSIGPIGMPGQNGLNGKDGLNGTNGLNAENKNVIHRSALVPTSDLGIDNDWCFNNAGESFYKENGRWIYYGMLIQNGKSRSSIFDATIRTRAGGTPRGSGQIKMMPGPFMTEPEQGSLEFDGRNLSFTPIAQRRNVMLSNDGVTTTINVTNTVVETVLFTQTFSANELDAGHSIKLNCFGRYTNATASDDFTLRYKLGNNTYTLARIGGKQTDAAWKTEYIGTIRVASATGLVTQYANLIDFDTAYSTVDSGPVALDTTGDLTITLTVQWANAKLGNIFSLTQGYLESINQGDYGKNRRN